MNGNNWKWRNFIYSINYVVCFFQNCVLTKHSHHFFRFRLFKHKIKLIWPNLIKEKIKKKIANDASNAAEWRFLIGANASVVDVYGFL